MPEILWFFACEPP